MVKTVGIYWNPLKDYEAASGGNPLRLFRKVVHYKANPRSAEYMKSLFLERHPGGDFIDKDAIDGWLETVACADFVALLYPDSIGLRFGGVEKAVFKKAKKDAVIVALNGRKRELALDSSTLGALRLRRFLERTMLFEFVLSAVFLVASPVLVVYDLLRGRR